MIGRRELRCISRTWSADGPESLMNFTNEGYLILITTPNFTERYHGEDVGWPKVSTRGRKFRATAEQVLNHLLRRWPA